VRVWDTGLSKDVIRIGVENLLPEKVAELDMLENRSLRLTASDEVFEALSSGTARQILQWLAELPGTISEIAADLDSSVQNVSYHVCQFERLGLAEQVGMRYSPKAQEIAIYALTIESLCIQFECPETDTTTVTPRKNDR